MVLEPPPCCIPQRAREYRYRERERERVRREGRETEGRTTGKRHRKPRGGSGEHADGGFGRLCCCSKPRKCIQHNSPTKPYLQLRVGLRSNDVYSLAHAKLTHVHVHIHTHIRFSGTCGSTSTSVSAHSTQPTIARLAHRASYALAGISYDKQQQTSTATTTIKNTHLPEAEGQVANCLG